MVEVQDLKMHLAKNRLNVSADILERAIVLPEEYEGNDVRRKYPNMNDLLFHNPFAKEKKEKKKGKKKKR